MSEQRQLLIGLTGCTGSGKSTVSDMLRELGADIIDADVVAREALMPEGELTKAVIEAFGDGILFSPGVIDRHRLAELVFSDSVLLERLNTLTHPYICGEMLKRADAAFNVHKKVCVVFDAPLLVETGLNEYTDEVWVVTSSLNARINRLMLRDSLSSDDIMNRIRVRRTDDELVKYANVVIENSGTITELRSRVKNLFEERIIKK